MKDKIELIREEHEKVESNLTEVFNNLLTRNTIYDFVEFIQERITDAEYKAIKKDVSKLLPFVDLLIEDVGTTYIFDGELREVVLLKVSKYRSRVYDINTDKIITLNNIESSLDGTEEKIDFADLLVTYNTIYK